MYGVPPFERRGTIACDGGGFLTWALERHFTEGETAPNFPQSLAPKYIEMCYKFESWIYKFKQTVYYYSTCGGTMLLHSHRELSTARPTIEWVKRIRTRFWDSLFHSYFVKILANPLGLAAFLPHLSEKSFITKFFDLKRMRFRGILVAFDCRQAVAFQRQIGQKYRNIAV